MKGTSIEKNREKIKLDSLFAGLINSAGDCFIPECLKHQRLDFCFTSEPNRGPDDTYQ